MKRLIWFLLFAAVVACFEKDGRSQNPPAGAIRIGTTQVQGGTPTDCLTVGTTGLLNQAACGGGGTPAAPSGSIQFNNSGAFGGSGSLLWDNSNLALNIMSGASPLFAFGTDLINGDPNCASLFSVNCFSIAPPTETINIGDGGIPIYIISVSGGATSIATTGTGGPGGLILLQTGVGGAASSANTSSTGGAGGLFRVNVGNGASARGTGINHGGNAGGVEIDTGTGGDTSAGTSNTGGNGGNFVILLGAGGVGSTANGTDGQFTINGSSTVFSVSRTGVIGTSLGGTKLPVCETNGVLYAGTNMSGVLACP